MNVNFHASKEQTEVIQHPAPIRVLVAGRGFGKTIAEIIELCMVALQQPRSRSMYISNSMSLAQGCFRAIKDHPQMAPLIRSTNSQMPCRIQWVNGSETQFRCTERAFRIRGEHLDFLAWDEAAYAPPHLMEEHLLPMLSARNGRLLACSTYNGRNEFYNLAQAGLKPNKDIKTFVFPSSMGIMFQGAAGRELLARRKANTTPGIFAQEYECEPLAVSGQVFRFLERALVDEAPSRFAAKDRSYIVSQDIARTVDNPAICIIDDQGFIPMAELMPKGVEHKEQAKTLAQIAAGFEPSQVIIDGTGGGAGGRHDSHTELYQAEIPRLHAHTWTAQNKAQMVGNAALMIEMGKVKIPKAHKELIAQIRLYTFKLGQNSLHPTYRGADGKDDLVSAFIQACWFSYQNWFPRKSSGSGSLSIY